VCVSMHQMKIAIADEGGMVSAHFGHCPGWRIYSITDSRIVHTHSLPNPGHEPGRLPALLAGAGVTHVLAGGMGPRAVDLFCQHGIEVMLGVSGRTDDVIHAFLEGSLLPGESACHHVCGSSQGAEDSTCGPGGAE
jgi:predicted Fe-Mo cluster-binding NifX family protein